MNFLAPVILFLGIISLARCDSGPGVVPLSASASASIKPDHSEPPSSPSNQRLANLLHMDIDALMDLEVTSVSKRQEKLFDSAAAVSVITNEDIHRSGMTSFPELLRTVPGLEVSQYGAGEWSVASRGFGGEFSNKLLVLMDGRTVYSPLFAGVRWDEQDYLFEDLDRIEVIRGPGSALWGANAMNGVINIVSKDSAQTQGFYAEGAYGTAHQFDGFRYGGRANDQWTYRVYEKSTNTNDFSALRGSDFDGYSTNRGGFRADWKPSSADSVTIQGDLSAGEGGNRYQVPSNSMADLIPSNGPLFQENRTVDDTYKSSGANLLARWNHQIEDQNSISLQGYYDRTYRGELYYGDTLNTLDLEFQHQISPWEGHQVVWGAGARGLFERVADGSAPAGITLLTMANPSRDDLVLNTFVQDTITLVPDRVHLTIGTKVERNDYTGGEVEPNIRLLWNPTSQQSAWIAISRAVRTPSRGEIDARVALGNFAPTNLPAGTPTQYALLPNPELKSEKVTAYEAGYRWEANSRLNFDLATFYNVYGDIISTTRAASPGYYDAFQWTNAYSGSTYGTEVAGEYRPWDFWKLRASYSWLRAQINNSGEDYFARNLELSSPQQQAQLHSSFDLPQNVSLDQGLYWVDQISTLDPINARPTFTNVPSYFRLDLRVAWRPFERWEISLVGQNLTQSEHLEQGRTILTEPSSEIPRAVYGEVSVKF